MFSLCRCLYLVYKKSKSEPFTNKYKVRIFTMWWPGRESTVCFAYCWLGDPTLRVRYPPHRFQLKTIHRIVFLTLKLSRVRFSSFRFALHQKNNSPTLLDCFWWPGRESPVTVLPHLRHAPGCQNGPPDCFSHFVRSLFDSRLNW